MIFQALTHKGYEKTPQQLLDKSRDADKKVDQHAARGAAPSAIRWNSKSWCGGSCCPSMSTAYEYKNPWDVPVANPLRPRPQPPTLCRREVARRRRRGKIRAKAGNAAGGGERGTHYVALTGLVPMEQQTAAYLDAFEGVHLQRPQVETPRNTAISRSSGRKCPRAARTRSFPGRT